MQKQTPLHKAHIAMGAKMVDFAGWHMPINYGSQIEEHHAVRTACGMFDVSHMGVIDITGEQVISFLQYLLANDVAKLAKPGLALYSCMLNEQGGILDDLIAYYVSEQRFRLVVNAATKDKDHAWIKQHALPYSVEISDQEQLGMIAIQGPQAMDRAVAALPKECAIPIRSLQRFSFVEYQNYFIARTGYTGEDGLEVIAPEKALSELWQSLSDLGVMPIGLGARDTLRLEAGMSLYGSDMDDTTTPLVVGLDWTIAWKPRSRHFIGRQSLDQQLSDGPKEKCVGLLYGGPGVLRGHQSVRSPAGVGIITSGSFSPTLKKSIALARVPVDTHSECEVEIRGKWQPAEVVNYPFVRNGKILL